MHNVEDDTIDLLALARALWKNILVIALAAVLVGSAAFAYTAFMIAPQYQATASLYVNNSSFRLGSTSFAVSSADLDTSSSLVSVYLYILTSRTTMEEVIKEADLSHTPEELRGMISAKGIDKTAAFEVTVTSTDPSEVELIANTLAKVLPERIFEIVDGTSVRIVDYAIIPSHRSGPNLMKNTCLGLLAGAALSATVVILINLMDNRSRSLIHSVEDLRAMYPDIMVLSMIPDMRLSEKKSGYYSSYYGHTDSKKKEGRNDGRSQGF